MLIEMIFQLSCMYTESSTETKHELRRDISAGTMEF